MKFLVKVMRKREGTVRIRESKRREREF